MNYRDKTKGELINELQKLQQECNSLKTLYDRDIAENACTKDKSIESEKLYQILFNSIDEGFCIVEVIFDEKGKPVDYRFLEINLSFEKQTGLIDAKGKRMRELAPNHEEHWFEIYGKIALTGQPARFENRAEQLNRWFDVYAFRVGQPENRQVAILFNDITERKKTENKLQFQLEILENIKEGIQLTSISDAKIVYANPTFEYMFGYQKDELIGKQVSILNAPGDKRPEELASDILKCLIQSEVWSGEIQNIRKDGSTFLCSVKISTFNHHEYGTVWISVHEDITAHKTAEEVLVKSEEKLKEAQALGKIGSWEYDIESQKVIWSDQTYKLYDRNPSQGPPTTEEEAVYYAPEQVKILHRYFRRAIEEGRNLQYDLEAKLPGGRKGYFSARMLPIKNANGRVTKLFGTVQDITERKLVEEALQQSETRYRELFNNISSGVAIYEVTDNGNDFIFRDFNRAGELMDGDRKEDIIGKSIYQVRPGIDKFGLLEVFKRVYATGIPEHDLDRFYIDEKLHSWYNNFVYKLPSGEIVAVYDNITERMQGEGELRKSKKLLEDLYKNLNEVRENERSQIALNLHDDLGQKLTAINLNITWIKSRLGVQSKAVKEKIEEMSRIINESIESIREISSFLRPAILFDLGLIPAFTWQLKRFEQHSGIKCNFHHESEEFKIDTPVSLILFRILQESLTNIARHSEASEANITLRKIKNKIEMLIKDNGIGIDVDIANSMTSMGIAGIKERVRSVKGTVLIKGRKGSWTFIKISIPLETCKKNDKSSDN